MAKSISAALLASVAVYLLGSFSAASFDIQTWPGDGRVICAFYMGIAGAVAGFLVKTVG